jgi:hypothetical protein
MLTSTYPRIPSHIIIINLSFITIKHHSTLSKIVLHAQYREGTNFRKSIVGLSKDLYFPNYPVFKTVNMVK